MKSKSPTPRQKYASAVEELQTMILKTIGILTPPGCQECSTHEIRINLEESGMNRSMKSIASHLGMLKKRGLIGSRELAQRDLWKLTARGEAWLKSR